MKERFSEKEYRILYKAGQPPVGETRIPEAFINSNIVVEQRNNRSSKSISKRLKLLKDHYAVQRGEKPAPHKFYNYST